MSATGGMSCAGGRHLRVKQVAARAESLSGSQAELIGDHSGCTTVALRDLSAHGVVLPVKAQATGILHVDGEGKCRDGAGVGYFHAFIVIEGLVGIDHG